MTTQTTTAPASDATRRPPWIKSVRADGTWQGGMATEVRVRGFEFRADEPAAVGGLDEAPTPMEILAGAVDACITVVVATVAAELGIRLQTLQTGSHAQMDTRGFFGTADVSPHFHDYRLTVRVSGEADDEAWARLRSETERRCPAYNLLKDTGIRLDLEWIVDDEHGPGRAVASEATEGKR